MQNGNVQDGDNRVITSVFRKLSNTFHNRDDNNNDIIRTNNSRFIDFPDTQNNIERNDQDDIYNDENELNASIFRYKFIDEFTSELYKFSKIHQYDARKDFKEAWLKWTEENSEIIEKEIRRLTEFGYEGDVMDKMFKSARYYFRKKSTEKKAPQDRRDYIETNRELLESMDSHIKTCSNYKPSYAFDLFCKENTEILKKEVFRLFNSGLKDPCEIKNKIKKTYKNRYFILIRK
jgi:hypothetical protein